MKRSIHIWVILVFLASCKKPEDRKCWKGHGDNSQVEFALDSIHTFHLGKRIKYKIYENNDRKIIIKGGKNMLKQVQLDYEGHELWISNENKCHFLRDSERQIEVEIHYPTYQTLNCTVSDSVIFKDTITSPNLYVKLEEGGGSLILNVNNNTTDIVVATGTGNYMLGGHSSYGLVKVQEKGFGDASNFTCDKLFSYQNSTADLYLNLEGAEAEININGTGDIFYTGTPDSLNYYGIGNGKLIAE